MNTWRRALALTPVAAVVAAIAITHGTAGAGTVAAVPLPPKPVTVCASADQQGQSIGTLARLSAPAGTQTCVSLGTPSPLGNGSVRTFSVTNGGQPLSIGVVFPASTLQNLPTQPTDGHHCYDLNGDGVIDTSGMTECMGGHERPLDLPPGLAGMPGVPLQWTLLNYNPHGHGPQGVYSFPHIDFHFYIQSKAERDAIRPGPCGFIVNCDDFTRGTVPVPAQYLPKDYKDVGAVEVAMGNHLVDPTKPEFNGLGFTHTWIYGAYDGKISFLEPMITVDWFQQLAAGQQRNACFAIKQPQAWQQSGWYPQNYCIRYAQSVGYTVSLESFVHA